MVLIWASFGDSYEKIGFLKSFISCLGSEEMRHVKNIVNKTASKTSIKKKKWIGERREPQGPAAGVSSLGEIPMATPPAKRKCQNICMTVFVINNGNIASYDYVFINYMYDKVCIGVIYRSKKVVYLQGSKQTPENIGYCLNCQCQMLACACSRFIRQFS
jgi:hypothetical protein